MSPIAKQNISSVSCKGMMKQLKNTLKYSPKHVLIRSIFNPDYSLKTAQTLIKKDNKMLEDQKGSKTHVRGLSLGRKSPSAHGQGLQRDMGVALRMA